MKKSEILEIIKKYGNKVSIHPSFDISKWAESLLNELENVGMLPPITKLENLGGADNAWDSED